MYRVRYYDQMIHPDRFNRGILGFKIRVLNWIRWRLETAIQKLVIKYIAKDNAVPSERTGEVMRAFRLDVAAEKVEKERTSPLHEESVTVPMRAERYSSGSVTTALETHVADEKGLPLRPTRLDGLISRYGGDGRARRYARGHMFNIGDPNGDFEPLSENDSE